MLEGIVATKRGEVARLRADARALRDAAEAAPRPASFEGALRSGANVALIAEVKRRSPSAGPIREVAAAEEVAAAYEQGGAAAVSVLTDAEYFGGSLADLRAVGARVGLPLLRKDFTIDAVQVYEARAAGAAAILLIVRILEDAALRELQSLAGELGMASLVEVHDEAELERALAADARIIGVNNRDLATFGTDLAVTERLARRVPAGHVLVGESGIRTIEDVARLRDAGASAVLVGEALMRAGDPTAATRSFASVRRRAG